jgi:hypothetical protein
MIIEINTSATTQEEQAINKQNKNMILVIPFRLQPASYFLSRKDNRTNIANQAINDY